MSQYLFKVLLGLSALALPLCADDTDDFCSDRILHSYFPQEFVASSLKKFKVPADQQAAIQKELAEKDKVILKLVQEKAEKMEPNPLKTPDQRKETVKLFRETLLAQFTEVMTAHGVTDPDKTKDILDDIQLQKARRAIECRKAMHKQPPAPQEEDEEQED